MNRQEMIEKRLRMPANEVIVRSNLAQKNLVSLECFKMARRVMLYLPIQNETDTNIILSRCIAKRVFAPRVLGSGIMEAAELFNNTQKGALGIEEPIGEAYTGDIDLYVVPGVFFSENGARTGRGKGYYDRFLAGKRGIKIGLCYSFQIDNNIETKETDVAMDFVVTDEGVFNE